VDWVEFVSSPAHDSHGAFFASSHKQQYLEENVVLDLPEPGATYYFW
jgi:hypothetical protein